MPSKAPTILQGVEQLSLANEFNDISEYLLFGIFGLAVLLLLVSYLYTTYIAGNAADATNYSAISQYLLNTGDFFTGYFFFTKKR